MNVFYLPESVESAIHQGSDVVVVQRKQIKAVQVREEASLNAWYVVGVEKKYLQRCKAIEQVSRQIS